MLAMCACYGETYPPDCQESISFPHRYSLAMAMMSDSLPARELFSYAGREALHHFGASSVGRRVMDERRGLVAKRLSVGGCRDTVA